MISLDDKAHQRPSRLLCDLTPPGVLSAQMNVSLADPGQLHPLEYAQVAGAVARRQRDYAAGRMLARALLAELGLNCAPLLNGPDRAPQWPKKATGSISHAAGLAVVCVAPQELELAIGCDIEPDESLPPGVFEFVATEVERASTNAGDDRLLFSAKEAFYKAQYAMTGAFLDFHDVAIDIDRHHASFQVTLRRPIEGLAEGAALVGRYRRAHGFIATLVCLPHRG